MKEPFSSRVSGREKGRAALGSEKMDEGDETSEQFICSSVRSSLLNHSTHWKNWLWWNPITLTAWFIFSTEGGRQSLYLFFCFFPPPSFPNTSFGKVYKMNHDSGGLFFPKFDFLWIHSRDTQGLLSCGNSIFKSVPEDIFLPWQRISEYIEESKLHPCAGLLCEIDCLMNKKNWNAAVLPVEKELGSFKDSGRNILQHVR